MFLVQYITGDFWRVLNVGEGPYTAGPGQKIIDNYNVTDSPDYENLRDKTYVDFVWDDNRKHMFLISENIRVEIYRQEKLKELVNFYMNNSPLTDQEFEDIATGIKGASTKDQIDANMALKDNHKKGVVDRVIGK